MLRNFFRVAWRNLIKDSASSFINIGGLAVGITVAMLIGLWIYDELSYNNEFKNYDRIAQVMQQATVNGNIYSDVSMPFPMGQELQRNFSGDFKYVVMASWEGDHILSTGDKNISQRGIYMDKEAPEMLSLNMLYGTRQGLNDPHSILLSASATKAIYGSENPLNKLLRIDQKLDVKVSGVFEDLPFNSEFHTLAFIAPWDLYITSETWIKANATAWDNNSFQIFTQIQDNSDFKAVDNRIANAKLNHVDAADKKYKFKIFLHPMADWHLRSHWDDNGRKTGGLIEYVRLFSIIGVFVLLLACINFMNLSTARSEKRAKEVGIRKAIGSLRGQLIGQFYCESLLVVVFAFALSCLFAQLALPWFNDIANKKMSVPWANQYFWLLSIGFIAFTSVIAGSYPALYLSSFQPVKVLKGTFRVGRFASIPRKILVVTQFTISLALVIGTMVVYKQVNYSKDRPLGYNQNGLMMIQMKTPNFYGKFDILKTTLKNSGAIVEFAESSSPLTDVWSDNAGFSWPGKDPNLEADFRTIWVTHDFGKAVSWEFKNGRDFSRDFPTDTSAIVLNQAAVKFMGIHNPIGTIVKRGDDAKAKYYKVIGVINDMLMESPYEPVRQTIYFLDYENVNWIILKLNPNRSPAESISKIQATFRSIIPSAPFEFKFADREFAAKFAAEERIGILSTVFAALAIFISCLGLFGLASFVAEQRTKEIGVRKVLGASIFDLWNLLSKGFVLLVIISLLIAIPISYYLMNNWLKGYPYRTEISSWVYVVAGLGALIITLVTVSFQAIKAAVEKPANSLRSE